ncbi:MAG: sigma-70 family RNA polymerase sigma factor [Planctomycetota bacterium]|nr:sigma-70 family RNA polymerase sigma factor [Planctomycetota bacterium]
MLLRQASEGEEDARGKLFAHYRDRLRRMVLLRMDRRLQGRLDPSDVMQETYITYAKRLAEYAAERPMPFFLWLRLITGQKLTDLHRQHLGAKMRTAAQEVSLHRSLPAATSVSLAAQLLGKLPSPSQAASWEETRRQVEESLNSMEPIDREVLALRHFEGLSNSETAQVLGLKKSAASNRYIRALKRLKDILATVPGFADTISK